MIFKPVELECIDCGKPSGIFTRSKKEHDFVEREEAQGWCKSCQEKAKQLHEIQP